MRKVREGRKMDEKQARRGRERGGRGRGGNGREIGEWRNAMKINTATDTSVYYIHTHSHDTRALHQACIARVVRQSPFIRNRRSRIEKNIKQ